MKALRLKKKILCANAVQLDEIQVQLCSALFGGIGVGPENELPVHSKGQFIGQYTVSCKPSIREFPKGNRF